MDDVVLPTCVWCDHRFLSVTLRCPPVTKRDPLTDIMPKKPWLNRAAFGDKALTQQFEKKIAEFIPDDVWDTDVHAAKFEDFS